MPAHLGNSDIGRIGEFEAGVFLEKHGFKILEKNFKKPFGEIDLVASKDRIIHFIEVKTSKYVEKSSFDPEMRVNRRKSAILRNICRSYLLKRHVSQETSWQIDVISIRIGEYGVVKELKMFDNAVADTW